MVDLFANIAHGCDSVRATKAALKMADYVVTEAGFGADLGAEKFFDIKCRAAGLEPDAVVLVATIAVALKYNGGVPKKDLNQENMEALSKGIANLEKHIENLHTSYRRACSGNIKCVYNRYRRRNRFCKKLLQERNCEFALSQVWEKGGEGGIELAKAILNTIETKESNFKPLYDVNQPIRDKITCIAKEIYGADEVIFASAAEKQIDRLGSRGYGNLPIWIAKNQYSLSDDPTLLGRPSGFAINIREVYVSAGAGFVVALTGAVMTMPGLPKTPAAYQIDVTDDGVITGLF